MKTIFLSTLLGVFVLSLLALSALAAPNPKRLFEELQRELPVGVYQGHMKTLKKGCTVTVTREADEANHYYAVVVHATDSNRSARFELREENENLEKVWYRNPKTDKYTDKDQDSYVGKANRDPRTAIAVGRGKHMKSKETYWEGWEKQYLLEIEEKPAKRGSTRPTWKITVGIMNAHSIGYGVLPCNIEAP